MNINEVTMTTVEIAAMTGKAHKNVLRDADRAIELISKSRASDLSRQTEGATEATFENRGKQYRMMVLNRHMVFTLITGYDTTLRYTVVGRWIELEQAANPAFASQAIADTLIALQARVDLMEPVYREHVRKGTTGHGHTWSAACAIADVPPQIAKAYFKATGRFAIRRPKVVSLETPSGPLMPTAKGFELGYFKRKGTGHGQNADGFNVTAKGLEWLKGHRDGILAWDAERKKVRPVLDADGFVTAITGEGSAKLTTRDL